MMTTGNNRHICKTNTFLSAILSGSTLTMLGAVAMLGVATSTYAATSLVIATVNNGHMIEMQKLSRFFERENPDIKLKWVTLEESALRQRLTTDIATKGGQFDVMTIGMYETTIWGKKGWLTPLNPDTAYNVNDLLPPVREGLTVNGKLYAAPFYGEGSMLMYRTDLAKKAGVTFPTNKRPTWDEVRIAASKMHDPANGVYGICLRGKPGWGDNTALISTIANTHGAQWFDMKWQPQLTSPAWKTAVSLYVDLLQKYGPPGSSSNGFNEILALFNEGRCGMWIDATIAASFITNPKQSKVANKVGFTQSPMAVTDKGATWIWVWSLAIPVSSKHSAEAQRFINWATSKNYIELVGRESGWAHIPTGTRTSTYANPNFQKAAKFAAAEKKAIFSANPNSSTLPPSPYIGIQFAAIPEFQAIGVVMGQQLSAALSGRQSVDAALAIVQKAAEREMQKSGYYK